MQKLRAARDKNNSNCFVNYIDTIGGSPRVSYIASCSRIESFSSFDPAVASLRTCHIHVAVARDVVPLNSHAQRDVFLGGCPGDGGSCGEVAAVDGGRKESCGARCRGQTKRGNCMKNRLSLLAVRGRGFRRSSEPLPLLLSQGRMRKWQTGGQKKGRAGRNRRR